MTNRFNIIRESSPTSPHVVINTGDMFLIRTCSLECMSPSARENIRKCCFASATRPHSPNRAEVS
ncbi:uncharacterized protein TRAVEDRAFT_26822 [Trametes versicolor FP-101664 SS1]|uniref:uncharacterized protein n=1 Tax=Trametes versicolor (strain FP-101664) TaxID=717944 RepID=UPI0004622A91|nr:uncharacterized protein TRAVEDRAFT_26822 [Trametes versicolor FP-101664 SS1]EIW63630.1 hypothetical protein TRAVEDRAFT_26822 [Trametes versicolor FP-101664 SS1]